MITSKPSVTAWDEYAAIRAIRRGAVLWERGDEDTCLIAVDLGYELVVTSDQINERQAYPGEDIRSLVRRGINEAVSDIAAAGAILYGVQIDVRAPDNFTVEDFEAVGSAVHDVLLECGGQLLQASNMSRGEFGISTTAIGHVPTGTAMRRSTAQPGDVLFISGPVGGWDAALAVFNSGTADALTADELDVVTSAFLDYRPELVAGKLLRMSGAVSACIDTNDCLPKACLDLASSSKVGLSLNTAVIPISDAAYIAGRHLETHPVEYVLNGMAGDDRLLFTVPVAATEQALRFFEANNFHPTAIGTITEGADGVRFVGPRRPLEEIGQRPTDIYSATFQSQRHIGVEQFPPAGRVLRSSGIPTKLDFREAEETAL